MTERFLLQFPANSLLNLFLYLLTGDLLLGTTACCSCKSPPYRCGSGLQQGVQDQDRLGGDLGFRLRER